MTRGLKPSARYRELLQGRTYDSAKEEAFRVLQLEILDESHERRLALDKQVGQLLKCAHGVAVNEACLVCGENSVQRLSAYIECVAGPSADATVAFVTREPDPAPDAVATSIASILAFLRGGTFNPDVMRRELIGLTAALGKHEAEWRKRHGVADPPGETKAGPPDARGHRWIAGDSSCVLCGVDALSSGFMEPCIPVARKE